MVLRVQGFNFQSFPLETCDSLRQLETLERKIMESSSQEKIIDPVSVRVEEIIAPPKRHHWLLDLFIQLVKTKPLGAFGGLLVLGMVLVAILAPVISPYNPDTMHGEKIVAPPSRTFYLEPTPWPGICLAELPMGPGYP